MIFWSLLVFSGALPFGSGVFLGLLVHLGFSLDWVAEVFLEFAVKAFWWISRQRGLLVFAVAFDFFGESGEELALFNLFLKFVG